MNPLLMFFLPLVLLAAYLLFRFIELKLIYVPGRVDGGTPEAAGLEYEDVWLTTENGNKIHGWWFPNPEARATILHCHGNADNISQRIFFAEDILRMPVNLLMYDYQGYGKSEGRPGHAATRMDGLAAYEFVRTQRALPIILLGQSLGGATAVELAAAREVDGLIIESTFTSVVLMGRRFYPFLLPDLLTTIRYDTLDKVPHLHMPKLFAHSKSDKKIPYDMGREIYEAAAEPKDWFDLEGGHGEESFRQSPGYHERVEQFVQAVIDHQE